jgi:hypothetical protein
MNRLFLRITISLPTLRCLGRADVEAPEIWAGLALAPAAASAMPLDARLPGALND